MAAKNTMTALGLPVKRLVINQTVKQFAEQLSKIKFILDANNGQENFAELAMQLTLTKQEVGIGTRFDILQAQQEYIQAKLINALLIIYHNLLQYKILLLLEKSHR